MNKAELLKALAAQQPAALLDLLSLAYDEMTDAQRQPIFGPYAGEVLDAEAGGDVEYYEVDGEILLREIERFQHESLTGAYYAPFRVNSRNYREIPLQTREWFARLGDMLEASCALSDQGDHECAVSCFGILYMLIEALENGKEIVFADEVGTWMLHVDQKQCASVYMAALAATATPAEFTRAVLPLIQRDAHQSFSTLTYACAGRVATDMQRMHLEAELHRLKIRTAPEF